VSSAKEAATADVIYTLGTSHRGKEEFLALLNSRSIQVVADVRHFPKSKLEHFAQENLEKWLRASGIEYLWLGASLGGYRKGGYEAYTRTPLFREGLMALEREAWQKVVVIICAEKLPWRCHRRLLSQELTRRGWKVVHLLEQGRIWQDTLAEQLTITPPPTQPP
jgi:uncharacterized protein (DUF488 family)